MGSYGDGSYSSEFYLDGNVEEKNLTQMMDQFYSSSYASNASFWQQGSIDKRFKAGDQSLYNLMYGDSATSQTRRFFFNLCRRHINMICGRQRQNRKSTITVPILDGDPLADEYNAVLKYCENRDGFQEYLSQAFEGSCDVGMSLLHLYPDYTLDPISGDLFTDNVSYNNFLIDPWFRKQDLTDCAFVWRRRWVNRNAAKALLPGMADKIDKMKPHGYKDGRFPLQAELINMDTNKLMPYDEFYYRTTREATIVLDPMTGEAAEWEQDEDDENDLMERTLAQQPWLMITKKYVPTVKLGICLGNTPMYHGPNLLKIDQYPFVPSLCYHEPDIQSYAWRVQGVIRNLRDPQYLYNRRKVIELQILESQINSGWIFPVDCVTDTKAFRQSGQGFIIPLKKGHLPNEIQRVTAPDLPPGMMELSRGLAEDITKISGVNEELLGAATDDKSGILSMLRQGAGLTTLQTIFDKLDYTQRLYGNIRLQAIRKNFSKGKIASILGRPADPRFFMASSLKYSVAVEEGNYSTTQRQMELQQLLHFRELGIPIANKSIIKSAFITNKQQVIEDMEEEQAQQMEQQKAQAEQQAKSDNADIMVKFAQAKATLAKEKESMANIYEKAAKVIQTEAETEHMQSKADLELVETMIKLEDMEINKIQKSLNMALQIREANNMQQQQNQMATANVAQSLTNPEGAVQ